MAKRFGTTTARVAGSANEFQGYLQHDLPLMIRGLTLTGTDTQIYLGLGRLVGEVPFAFQLKDFASNERGFNCAEGRCGDGTNSNTENCIKCCSDN